MSRGKTRHKGGGGTPATVELTAAAVPFTEHEYAHDPREQSYGTEAAQALGLDPGEVFKTLLVRLEGGGHDTDLGVVVVPVDVHVDLKAAGAAFGAKRAAMADPAVAARTTGYVVGGISPVGQKKPLPTVLDESATGHPTVLISGGKRGLDLELSPADLLRVTGGSTAAIARRR